MLGLMLAAAVALPPDLRAYVERRDACEHYAGEEAFDAARGRFLEKQIKRFGCLKLDADRKRLRAKHPAPAARKVLRPLYY